MALKWDATKEEHDHAEKIVSRFILRTGRDKSETMALLMDLIATHANGCPLDLAGLAAADDEHLVHDMGGINQHIDRQTGQLTDCFLPRYART